MERSNTVYWWLNLSQEFNESYAVNESWVASIAEKYYDYAENIFSYANILSEETGYSKQFVRKAEEMLQRAYVQKDNYPAASLFNSLEAIANSNLAIEMIGNNAIYEKINRTSQMASYSIEKARNMSIEPILAVSYAEFGRSFENQDAVNSLTYYKYAYMIANMLCLAKEYKGKELQKNVVINKNNENKQSKSSEIYWPTITGISFVAGIGIGMAIRRGKREEKVGKEREEIGKEKGEEEKGEEENGEEGAIPVDYIEK